ncbi:PREDICTED: dehydrin ERD10-like [Camelina sativa]|uniref:Dehydrin ERD10-like n=1 Tax=Camelina sativa TaxID=90675 RepID=A0ABM0TUR4_CAMSA|nr:PREDICTED: dehydrin ERD10-like [Camelina sativa]
MADHPRSSEQQEADAAASKGCGMFDFLKKKPEDAHSSENAGVIKEEEKPSLAERLHRSDTSSSDEEAGENGGKKEKKKKNKEAADQCETEEKKGIMEKIKEKLPAGIGHPDQAKPEHEDGKEKGFMEKVKDKLPGGDHGKPELEPRHDNGKEKGFMEKIKEKLPGHKNDEKKKET